MDSGYIECDTKISDLNVRVVKLELVHEENIRSIERHNIIIDKLLSQDNTMLISLNTIGSNLELATQTLSGKIDSLIGKFITGFKVLCACTAIVCMLIGAVWQASKDIGLHIEPKLAEVRQDLVENTARTETNTSDIAAIARKKVIAASK